MADNVIPNLKISGGNRGKKFEMASKSKAKEPAASLSTSPATASDVKHETRPATSPTAEKLPGVWKACEPCGYEVDPVRANLKGPICENCGRPRYKKEVPETT